MMKPAEAARAPEGPTKTATGVRQLSILSTICRIELSRPPGVSIRITTQRRLLGVRALDRLDHVGRAHRVDDAVQLDDRDLGARPAAAASEEQGTAAAAEPPLAHTATLARAVIRSG